MEGMMKRWKLLGFVGLGLVLLAAVGLATSGGEKAPAVQLPAVKYPDDGVTASLDKALGRRSIDQAQGGTATGTINPPVALAAPPAVANEARTAPATKADAPSPIAP